MLGSVCARLSCQGSAVVRAAVLGAGAVCAKDLEAWTVYVGNPAREVSKRKATKWQLIRLWRKFELLVRVAKLVHCVAV